MTATLDPRHAETLSASSITNQVVAERATEMFAEAARKGLSGPLEIRGNMPECFGMSAETWSINHSTPGSYRY